MTDSGGGVYQTSPATWSLTVNKAKTQLTNVLGNGVAGTSSGHLQATLSSFKTDGTTFNKNLAGKTVTFKIDGNTVGTDVTDVAGLAELNAVDLSGVSAGGHNLTADFAGDDGYLASTGNGPMVVAPPPDSTGPEITPNVQGTQGDNGWYTSDVTVSWNVSDPDSPISSSNGCETTTINSDTVGQTLTCTATSGGGTSSQSVIIKRDATNPNVTATADRNADHNGWYNHALTVSFAGTDVTSGNVSCDPNANYSGSDTNSHSLSGSCTDEAGNSASATFNFKYDATAPTSVATTLNRAADHNGWYNYSVGWTTNGTDATSGIASCDSGTYSSPDGTGLTVSGKCTDDAGNASASVASAAFKYDATKPTLNPTVSPNPVLLGGTATASAGANDVTSLIDASNTGCDAVNTSTIGAGQTVSCHATDNAGNTNSASATYSVGAKFVGWLQPVDGDGSATGAVNMGKVGRTYPIKWQLKDANDALISDAAAQALVSSMSGSAKNVTCGSWSGLSTDSLEDYTTGNTTLRYDATSDQFIFNYKAPSSTGCQTFVISKADGLTANKQANFNFTK